MHRTGLTTVPAGDYCRPLPNIEHGGVIYTDLLISTGIIATYVCEQGYSLHGHGKYECAVDGVWLGNKTGQLPTCEGEHKINFRFLIYVHACTQPYSSNVSKYISLRTVVL